VRTNVYQYGTNAIDLLSVTNSLGQYVNLGYNTNHQLSSATNALGQMDRAAYAPSTGHLTNLMLASGLTLTRSYYRSNAASPNGNLLSNIVVSPLGLSLTYTWTNGLPWVVHASGTGLPDLWYTNFWDGLNRLTGTVFPDGTSVSNVYDRLYPGATKDRLGYWTYFGYDPLQHLISVTDALSNLTQYGWCDCGALGSITDATGTNVTVFNRNNQGVLTNKLFADGSSLTWTLDSLGRPIQVADGQGRVQTAAYNNQGLLTVVSNSCGVLERVVYDAADRLIQVTDEKGVTHTNTFNLIDQLLTRTWLGSAGMPAGVEGFLWSTNGLVAYTNQDNKVTWCWRDGAGRLLGVTNANLEVTRFAYNALDEYSDLWDGLNQHTGFGYNEWGWLLSKTNALSQVVLRLSRDANGQVTNRWTPQFGNTGYVFDPVGNLKQINYAQSTITYAYDVLNRLRTMVDPVGTTTFGHTPTGDLQSEAGPWATLSYGYTEGLRTSMSVGSLGFGYHYDSAWRMDTLTSPAGTFGYGYDAQRWTLPTLLTLPNQAFITNHFDTLARLDYTALVNPWGHVLDGYSYGMDLLGLRTNIVRNLGLTSSSVSVGYDQIAQIIAWSAKEANGTPRLNEQVGLGFDKAGNLLSRTNGGLIQTFNCDALNELTNITRNSVMTVSGNTPAPATSVTVNGQPAQTNGDFTFAATNLSLVNGSNTFTIIAQNAYGLRVTNIDICNLPSAIPLAYDLNGNLTNDGSRSFAYDAENQLTNVTVTNAAAATSCKTEFVYDGLGRRRITKEFAWQGGQWVKTNETRSVCDGYLLVQERDTNNNVLRTYSRGPDLSRSLQGAGGIGGLLARTDANGSTFYHSDGAGNVTALMDGAQNVAARYMQDAFGRMIGEWGPMGGPNTMGFSSMPRLDRGGVVGFPRRFYDPALQRFLNQDPIGVRGGINLYQFVGNNPISAVDPLGLAVEPEGSGPLMLLLFLFGGPAKFLTSGEAATVTAVADAEASVTADPIALRVRHFTSPDALKGIQRTQTICPSRAKFIPGRGDVMGVHVEVGPRFGPVETGSAETGAYVKGAYVEFDAPGEMFPTDVGARTTAVIPTESPLSIADLNPEYVNIPWWKSLLSALWD
jgi:RHS repeat-associated protein